MDDTTLDNTTLDALSSVDPNAAMAAVDPFAGHGAPINDPRPGAHWHGKVACNTYRPIRQPEERFDPAGSFSLIVFPPCMCGIPQQFHQ